MALQVRWVLEDAKRPGGVEHVVAALDAGLRGRGVDSEVHSWRRTSQDAERAVRGGWLLGKVAAAHGRSGAADAAARALARDLKADPDLVVLLDPGSLDVARRLPLELRWGVHVHWSPDLLLQPWRHVGGEGVSGLFAGLLQLRLRQVGRRNAGVLRRAPFLVTLTPSHTELLVSDARHVIEVPNPVALRPTQARTPPAGVPTVGFVGRLVWEKGPDVFLEAVALLRRRLGSVKVVIAGSGPWEAELRAMATSLGLSDISWLGWVDDTTSVFSALDVLILPSRTEALGLVLLQALAAGCSVVAADAGSGVRDVLLGGRLGAIVAVNDPAALASSTEEVLANPPRDREGFERQLDELRTTHDPERVLDRWQELLADLGGSGQGA